jgi:hypothetical protein
MKKSVIFLGALAAIVIAVVIMYACNKQAEESSTYAPHSLTTKKTQKGALIPCSYAKRFTNTICLPSGKCATFEVVCCNCLIDGWIWIDEMGDGPQTFHAKYINGEWVLSPPPCNGDCLPELPDGWTYDDLLEMLNDPWFAPCCGEGGGGGGGTSPCDPVQFVFNLPSVGCVTFDIECCDGKINGTYYIVECETGEIYKSGVFCAVYTGDRMNQSEFNDPGKWEWCGDSDAPDDLLEIITQAWLLPCII